MEHLKHARFWSRVNVRARSDCWEWLGSKNDEGYGRVRWPDGSRKSPVVGAHRVAFEIARGGIPSGMLIRHTCDNPTCVNPEHLLIGTKADNASDMVLRGRHVSRVNPKALRHGDRHYWSKLTEADVFDIYRMRQEGKTLKLIALAKGVTLGNVAAILKGRSWKHAWAKWHCSGD